MRPHRAEAQEPTEKPATDHADARRAGSSPCVVWENRHLEDRRLACDAVGRRQRAPERRGAHQRDNEQRGE